MKKLAAVAISLCLCASAYAQTFTNGGGSGGGGIPATGNIALSVNASTGNDPTCAPSGVACATVQRAVNIAAQYNYNNLYAPTINVADGAYTSVNVTLPALVNCLTGGTILGDASTPTNLTLADNGSAYTFVSAPFSIWTINGVDFHGTYGGTFQPAQWSSLTVNNINFSGTLANGGFNIQGGLFTVGASAKISTSTSSMGTLFNSAVATVVIDFATITFTNPITVPYLITSIGFFAADDTHFVNGSNVTASTAALLLNEGAFFEADTTTLVDGVAISRANFPGHAGGFNIDGWSFFQADGFPVFDTTQIQVRGSAPLISLNDTETNGQNWNFFPGVSSTIPYFALYASNAADFIPIAFNVDGNNSAQITSQGVYGWIATTRYAAFSAMDTGFSRLGPASSALGNGTTGDFSGTLKLAHLTATALANTATTSAVCYNTSTGVLTYDGTVGTCTTSDERLKNIGPRIDDALSKLLSINGFYFTYKDADKYGKDRQIGVGAQTVEKVFPELVETGSDGIKSVAYEKLAAPIIEAMRELKGELDRDHACLSSWHCRLFGM